MNAILRLHHDAMSDEDMQRLTTAVEKEGDQYGLFTKHLVQGIRGGSWNFYPRLVRSAYRFRNTPDIRNNNLGFRLVLPVQQSR